MIKFTSDISDAQRDGLRCLTSDTPMNRAVRLAKVNNCRIIYDENKRVFIVKPKIYNTLEKINGIVCQTCFNSEATMQNENGDYMCSKCYNNGCDES